MRHGLYVRSEEDAGMATSTMGWRHHDGQNLGLIGCMARQDKAYKHGLPQGIRQKKTVSTNLWNQQQGFELGFRPGMQKTRRMQGGAGGGLYCIEPPDDDVIVQLVPTSGSYSLVTAGGDPSASTLPG